MRPGPGCKAYLGMQSRLADARTSLIFVHRRPGSDHTSHRVSDLAHRHARPSLLPTGVPASARRLGDDVQAGPRFGLAGQLRMGQHTVAAPDLGLRQCGVRLLHRGVDPVQPAE